MRIVSLLLSFFLMCSAGWAQSTAQINGSVKDQTGAVLPGVEVTATQTATGAKRTAVTDETGAFILATLPIGPYMIEAALPGFKTYVQTGVVLQVNSNPTVNVVLEVGQVADQIEVQADAALVETSSTGVGTVMDNTRVLELPLNGRNAAELIFLAGMATPGNGGSGLNSVRNYPTVLISVAGGQGNGLTYLLDGANHNDPYNNSSLPFPFPDALQEFKVETSALPAQYGFHSAAAVNAVTKSGTNDFHGNLFEFVRNGKFNARDFFAAQRDTLKRNQFGGTIGGPIMKNKLFFFGGYQKTTQRSDPAQNVAYIPTAAMLAGDFTTVASTACQPSPITLATSQGFVNNTISPSRFNPVALKLASLFPATSDPCGKVLYGLTANQDEHLGVGRLDYQLSDKHSLFGRFTLADLTQGSTYNHNNPLTVNVYGTHDRIYTIALGDTYLFGSGLVSTSRASMSRTIVDKTPDAFYSFKDLGANVTPEGGPVIKLAVSGGGDFSVGSSSSVPGHTFTGPNPSLSQDFSVIKGAHQIGFGGSYGFQLMNYLSGNNATGSMSFNGTVSGLGLADFLIGQASSWNQGNMYGFYNRQHYLAVYGQDAWKVTPRLTFNYGLRWEPYTSPYSKYGAFAHFEPELFDQGKRSQVFVNAPPGLIFPGDPEWKCGRSINCDVWNKFVPRFGLVWDPKGDGRMTVRAAVGMFADRQHMFSYNFVSQAPPFGNNVSLSNVNMSDPWATYAGGNPIPVRIDKNTAFPTLGGYINQGLHDFKPTYVNQWNLSIQRQLGNDWLVSATYLGNSTIHLTSSNQLNPAEFLGLGPCTLNTVTGPTSYPVCSTTQNQNIRRVFYQKNPSAGQYFAGIAYVDFGGTASYNGLNLSTQKRLTHGTSILANYTWSHCISDVFQSQTGGSGNAGPAIPGDRRAYRGNCDTSDQRHVFNFSAVLQTPKFANATLSKFATGWQLSPILKLKTGQYFTVTSGVDRALTATAGQTVNLVPGVDPYAENKSVDGWLNKAAFAMPALGTYGNLGYNNLLGPGAIQVDLSLSRTFTVREGQTLQLHAESFNVPNHLNPSNPISTFNSANFGKILKNGGAAQNGQSSGDPRIMQFALKYVF